MLWFNGSIRSAVDKVKSSGACLLVFVQGEDPLSGKYEAFLNEKTILKLDEFVALKIPYDSQALQQFKQIYVSVPIPSVFLIQDNGIPLKVISSTDTSEIHNAINETVSKRKLRQEKKQKVCSNNISLPNEIRSRKSNGPDDLSHIKTIGHKLFDISEDELKTRMKEIRAFPKFLLVESPKSCDPPKAPRPKIHSARIQFRLPDNSMPSWEFPGLSTLGDVRAYLMEKLKISPNFKLLSSYPRYAFTKEDEDKTLEALSLTPTAIMIVVPYEDKIVQARMSSLLVPQNFLKSIVNFLMKWFGFMGFFKKYFFRNTQENQMSDKFSGIRSFERTIKKKVLTSESRIHGFKFDDGTDTDTEHPDNGNSTQQRFQ